MSCRALITLVIATIASSVAAQPTIVQGTKKPAAVSSATSEPGRNLSPAERAYVAARAFATIRAYFAHWEGLPKGFELDAAFRGYLDEAMAAPDRRSFSMASMRFFASLNNGHTSFTDTSLLSPRRSNPVRIRRLSGRWVVTWSRIEAIDPGTVIETVDGIEVDQWIAPYRAMISASNDAARDDLVFQRISLLPERFTLGATGGRRFFIDLTAAPSTSPRGQQTVTQTTVTSRADGVVVIKIPAFDEPAYEGSAIAAVKANIRARAIILDVRDNGGGSTPNDLLSVLMDRPYRGTVFATPMTIAVLDARGVFDPSQHPFPAAMVRSASPVTEPTPGAYTGKVVVLTDRGCASACEDFLLRFRAGGRGPIVGESTAGTTGQPYVVDIPGLGLLFRVSTKREYYADGSQFEGVGVHVDVPAPLTRAELFAGRDDQLETAARVALSD